MNRSPAVAGRFYPGQPEVLRQMVLNYLDTVTPSTTAPKAMIAPHAGYIYSGSIAASVYARLLPVRNLIKRVVLIGPCHRVAVKGLAISSADTFSTPLGVIAVDQEAITAIRQLPFIEINEPAHLNEHSLEVQLPFLQATLADFKIVPLVTGNATPDQVGQVITTLWGGEETLIVISSDLSHYHDYATAQKLDQQTTQHIEAKHYEQLQFESACGRVAISGLLKVAREKNLAIKTVDVRNSGDTAGDKTRVVGYGAYVID